MMLNKSRKYSQELAAVAAEFAIGFPMLLVLIMMLVDSGLYLFQRSLLTDATAGLNRAIVTQLGQREAEASRYSASTPPPTVPSCAELLQIATNLKDRIAAAKAVIYEDMSFELKIKDTPPNPFRLVTTKGTKPFTCLTCRFFPSALNIIHRSVLAIERPAYTGLICSDLDFTALP